MYHDFTYQDALASSLRAQWHIDDVLRADQELDFTLKFLPETLARTDAAPGLDVDERRTLNQLSAHQYLCLFGVVEEFILPFVLDHARPLLRQDDYRIRALLNFAGEEAKHIQLFKRFDATFVRGSPIPCEPLPSETLGRTILSHHPLAVGLAVLMIEWMTQEHYLGTAKAADDIDPLFKRLLKYHWMEEAQHAKLDTLIVDALAKACGPTQIPNVIKHFFSIIAVLDAGLKVYTGRNIWMLEKAIGRNLTNRDALIEQQYQAARWTYFGMGMTHPRFTATLRHIAPSMAATIADFAQGEWPFEIAALSRRPRHEAIAD